MNFFYRDFKWPMSLHFSWMPTTRSPTVRTSYVTCLGGPCRVRSKLTKFDNVWSVGSGPYMGGGKARALNKVTPEQNDRHNWKHYLPATSLAGGNKCGCSEADIESRWVVKFLFQGRRLTGARDLFIMIVNKMSLWVLNIFPQKS